MIQSIYEIKRTLYFYYFFITQFTTAQLTGKIIANEDNYPLEYATVALYRN